MAILGELTVTRASQFWGKVSVMSPEQCWTWQGALNRPGYGQFKIGRTAHWAHRVAYSLDRGEDIGGLVVRHQCDNPSCCNPHHLIAGTLADNVADRVARWRSAFGTKSCNAKLTDEDVRRIRADSRTAREIADDYGVHSSNVCRVKSGQSWRHVE